MNGAKSQILIADDEPQIQELFSDLLSEDGYAVTTVGKA